MSCAEERAALGLSPRDCAVCEYPGLLLTNLPAWEVIQTTGATLFDGWGGVHLANARETCEALGYVWNQVMIRKVAAAAAALREKESKGDGDQ